MFLWHAISADTLFGNLREFELEGQHTRQRYSCVHHASAIPPFVSFRCVRQLPLMGIKKAKTNHGGHPNGFKQLKTCVLMI